MSLHVAQQTKDVVVAPQITIDLKAEVEAAVKPYASDTTKPPISVAELMVMAWVCRKNDDLAVSDEQISDWIFLTFGYYHQIALKELHRHANQEFHSPRWSSLPCRTPFLHFIRQRVFQLERLDFPLSIKKDHEDEQVFQSTTASSRQFLRRILKAELPSFSRFFQLPPELRMMVYEEVFQVDENCWLQYDDEEFNPQYGTCQFRLSVSPNRPKGSLVLNCTKQLNTKMRHEKFRAWATESTSQILALLCANRQIFEEAMPVFYNINTFAVPDIHGLSDMLLHCGARRRPFFTSIAFRFTPSYGTARDGPKASIKAFDLLKDVKCLRSLKVCVSDNDFLKGPGAKFVARYSSVGRIPGIRLLSEVRVLKLDTGSNCPLIDAYLRPKMLKPSKEEDTNKVKAKTKPAKKSRKKVKTT
jgi:hypothetical protein